MSPKTADPRSVKALILAPRGRDASVAQELLADGGFSSVICATLAHFEALLGDDVCFAIVAEEAMRSADLRGVASWVTSQPPWSDLPFIVLTKRTDSGAIHPETPRLVELLGNVTLLERPFHRLTLVSVVRTANRGRMRQYEARSLIADLRESEEALEFRVQERTAALNEAHAVVLDEIAQRQHAEDLLRQAQKMEMIGQLTGGVAHDFNNLLMAVMSNLELLRKRVSHDHTSLRLIDGAWQGAQRGASLTQRLLAFARKQDLKVEPINLAELLRGMRELIQRSIGNEIELVMRIPREVQNVLADANQIELAILNLVVNSRDAMPAGGRILVELAASDLEPPAGEASDAFIRLSVVDNGRGMDAATLQKATEPFFTTKELGKGTGLGLSMIHGLVRQLGGTLRLSSEVGRGTRADIFLPATEAVAVVHHAAEERESMETETKLTIMVVDDDALISMSTALMVEDLGHNVVEVNSASQALKVLGEGKHIDLLITDYSMPKMNGVELVAAAKLERPGLPVLLATGYAELPKGSGSDLPRIGKPYQQEQLATAIAHALGTEHGIAGAK